MITQDQVISIGTLAKPFGTQGAVLCHTKNDLWTQAEFLILSIDNILVPFRVLEVKEHGLDLVFSLANITTEAQARCLTNREAFMLRSDMSDEEEDQMLWTDFVGYTVIDTDQGALGTITAIDDSTENILATLHSTLALRAHTSPSGAQSTIALRAHNPQSTIHPSLIPLHEDFIRSIDEDKRVLTITLPYQL